MNGLSESFTKKPAIPSTVAGFFIPKLDSLGAIP